MGTIFIRDLVVRGIIGVNAHEREHPQDFVINIDFRTNVERAGTTDNILDSVDYQSMADKVKAHAVTVGRYTVEALATDVAGIVLNDTRVDSVRVRVEKPGVVPGSRSVGVEIERCRPRSGRHWACLGLGSNSNPAVNLPKALSKLRGEVDIDAVSSAWDSSAIADDHFVADSPNYVNAAVLIQTQLAKSELVTTLKQIENELGRVRTAGLNSLVTIDIDLLLFDDVVEKKDLWKLAYRAMPAAELLPSFISPETSEPLWAAAHRLAAETKILPRFDIFHFSTSIKTS